VINLVRAKVCSGECKVGECMSDVRVSNCARVMCIPNEGV